MLVFERIGWDRRRLRALERPGCSTSRSAFVTPTRHAGQVCTRFAIVNPLTTADDLALLIDSMQ